MLKYSLNFIFCWILKTMSNSLFCNILWYLIRVCLSILQYIWLRYTWFDHVIFIRFMLRRRQAILRSFHCPIGRWYWKYKTIYFHKIRHIIEFTRINWISLRETFLTHQLHTRTHFHIGSKTLGCHVTITDFEPTLTRFEILIIRTPNANMFVYRPLIGPVFTKLRYYLGNRFIKHGRRRNDSDGYESLLSNKHANKWNPFVR